MLANFLSRLYHACWYITAAIIITAAVTVTVIRLMLPQINDYKPQVEDWISDKTGFVIAVENINAHWEGWTPTLLLNGIQVKDKTSERVLTTLESASVTVNPYISLQQQDLTQLQITIVGPDLLITRQTDGSIEFANIDSTRQQSINTGHGFFADWVLRQRSIAIENASITYVDKNNPDTDLVLSDVNMHLRSSHSRTQVAATADLPAEYGDTLKVSLDAFGDITSPDWNGRIYFEGNHIYPVHFLGPGDDTRKLQPLKDTPATIHVWSDWNNGQAGKIRGEIAAADIQLPAANERDRISALAAAFSIDRVAPGIRARINIRELQSDQGKWQPAVIDIYRKQSAGNGRYRYIVDADYLKIDDILPFLHFIEPGFNVDNGKDISGVLVNSQVIYEPEADQKLYFHSDIQALTIADQKNNTSIFANGGTVSGTPQWGQVQFHSSTLELSLPHIFNRDINFYELNGDFNWSSTDNGLLIETDYFDTHTPHFDTTGKVKIVINPEQESPLVDLQLSNTNINMEQLVYYVPVAVHNNVRKWMKSALVSGEITRLDILLRGYLHEFPYSSMDGNFQAIAWVKNAVLDYHPDWIPAEGINARFRMDNSHIEVNADAGSIHNAIIDKVVATIPDVTSDKPGLLVEGSIHGDTAEARYIIDNSPLSESGTLAGIKHHDINGQLQLDLTLNIPFYKKDLNYDGHLHLKDTRLQSAALGITLEDINGNIDFNRKTVSSESLQGSYSGQPVMLDIKTDNESRLLLSLEGHSDSHFITSQLIHFFPKLTPVAEKLQEYLDGAARWSASMVPDKNDGPGAPGKNAMLSIESDLSGLKIFLPNPLGKGEEPAPLKISTIINGDSEKNIHIEYNNNLLAGISIIQNGQTGLKRAEIAVGRDSRLFDSGNGIFIHGAVERLSLSDWEKFIHSIKQEGKDGEHQNIQVDLQVDSLEYLEQKFSNTGFRINNLQPDLYITLEGDGIDGKIVLPEKLQQSPVKATFSTLHLRRNETEKQKIKIDPRSKPPLDITVSDFSYGDIQLGEMTLVTTQMADGLSINTLAFSKPGIKISGNGRWQIIDDVPRSDFEFKLKADKLDDMLTTFNYSVAPIEDGKTKLTVNANWNGSPMDFSLADINGTLGMDIEKGQFLDIEPSAGRLFGLLSLQTLPRRLSLDFSDLFGKGFSFDKIEGTFTLESGNAYTNNLSMTGPSAYIQVNGRTGLVDKDYDQIVTVTPQISDSLPIASALFGPIGVGVGAVLYLAGELFESIPRQIDKLLRYQYSVKGSWDDPEVKKIQATASTETTVEPFNQ